jgi:hypothetical protein
LVERYTNFGLKSSPATTGEEADDASEKGGQELEIA